MNTLIAYASKHGATRTYAERLAQTLSGQVTLADLSTQPNVDPAAFDQVIIGSAIYTGVAQKAVRDFCTRNLGVLKQKRLGLFICCLFDGQQGEQQLQQAFPEELRNHALITQRLSGSIDLKQLGFLERQMTKLVGVKESRSGYSDEAVRSFSAAMTSNF